MRFGPRADAAKNEHHARRLFEACEGTCKRRTVGSNEELVSQSTHAARCWARWEDSGGRPLLSGSGSSGPALAHATPMVTAKRTLGSPSTPSRDPSRWSKRVPLALLALVGCAISTRLGAYQLGLASVPPDPFFTGTAGVLNASLSRALPVPDAVLGAGAYAAEVALTLVGARSLAPAPLDRRRLRRTRPLDGNRERHPRGGASDDRARVVLAVPRLRGDLPRVVGPALTEALASIRHLAHERHSLGGLAS
jgi:hypothetical protein